MRSIVQRLAPMFLLGVMFSVSHAQAVKGSLLGTILDANGAAAAGATVTLTETRTNISATTTTNSDGNYSFPNLKDGVYRVEASQKGFKKVVRENVVVAVNTTVRVDLNMQVGDVSESVTVTADAAPLLQTDRADTGRLLESKQVSELPLGFNRNFQGLLVTVPGASRPTRPHSQFFNSQDSLESKVNGQSRLSNNFQIEGVDDNEKTGLLQVLIPAADAIETVSVATSNFDAEFGRAGGAVSSVTLKSGTNDIHGSAFLFGNNNNGWLQAGDFFTHGTAPTHYRQAGGTIGGPIKKNKLFYFGDYQYTTDALGAVQQHTAPYAEWYGGDFSKAATTIYDPATTRTDSAGNVIRDPFPNNIIPDNRISPIAKKLLAFLNKPNAGPAPGAANYFLGQVPNLIFNEVRIKTTHAFDTKVNYNISEKNVLSYRFSYQRPEVFDPGTYGIYGGPTNGGFAGTGTQNTISTAGNYTRTFSPTLILEARFGVSWYHNVAISQAAGLKTSSEIGIPNVNTDSFSDGLTQINISGFSGPVLGFSNSLPWDRGEKTYIGSAILTKLWGNHSFKFGEEIRHNRDFLLQIQDNGGVRGHFDFNGNRTATSADTKAQAGIANAFASFLLDLPNSVGRDIKVIDQPGTQHYAAFSFAQDTWQMTQKLTLILGLRHEYYQPLVGIVDKGGLSNYLPDNNTAIVAGYGDIPQNVRVKGAPWRNFAPRLGAAYRLSDKTVIRAGFGTSIVPFPDNSYAFNFPVKQNNQFNAPNAFAPAGSMAAGFPAPIVFAIPSNGIIDGNNSVLKNSGVYYAPPDLREAKLHSYNVAFQRQMLWGITAEAAYVGNYGQDVIFVLDLNAANQLGKATVASDNPARPYFSSYGRTASITTRVRKSTTYNSLQVKVDKRFSHGLLFTSNYTLGRSIDYAGGDQGTISTPADVELSRGRSDFDRTHSFTSSFVWQLPFAQKLHGPAKWALDGWQFTGILDARTGTPLDFTTTGVLLHAPGNTQRANATGTPKVNGAGIRTGELYFDTSVFSTPTATLTGTSDPNLKYAPFGNVKRNSLINGPGYWNLDSSIFKKMKFTERIGGEIRADIFNILNHPNPANPSAGLTSTTFGQITGISSSARLVRLGARVTF
ncbi:MAG: TonB-dependent receptor [Acidobacteria bacterium]|nr:TonB-dependent receptor [Acidobacteriota bacterium]